MYAIRSYYARLNGLISDFLAYAGPKTKNVVPVNMAGMVAEIVEAVLTGEARESYNFV